MNKLQKHLKPVLQKLGTLQFPSPNGLGFQVQKLIMANLKVEMYFSIFMLKLFSPEPPRCYVWEKKMDYCTDFLIRHIVQSCPCESGNEAAWKLVTNWLRHLSSGNSPHVSWYVIYPFLSFIGYFPCFCWCFSQIPILGHDMINLLINVNIFLRFIQRL